MKITNCPDCFKPVVPTKTGKIPRHGQMFYHSGIRGRDLVYLKDPCSGSGRKYMGFRGDEDEAVRCPACHDPFEKDGSCMSCDPEY